jgi:predicted ArsR family transcriptional regulator
VKYILQRSADVGVDIFVTPGAGRPRGIFRIRKSAEAEFSQELEPLLEPKIDGDEPNATAGRLQERERQRQRQRQQQGRRRDDIIEQLG